MAEKMSFNTISDRQNPPHNICFALVYMSVEVYVINYQGVKQDEEGDAAVVLTIDMSWFLQ